jgi:uncharacterized membrane protein YdbT with pleckstrin-like domain
MQEIKIQQIYIVKKLVGSCIGFIIVLVIILGLFFARIEAFYGFSFYLVIMAIVFPFSFVFVLLRVMTFSFDLGDDFINIKQGIISRQERHVPYSVIQNVIVKQDILDRVFGLSTIVVENAAGGGMPMPQYNGRGSSGGMYANRNQYGDYPGMTGNMLMIPGLARKDAITLRDLILNKTEKAVSANSTNQL